MPTLEWIGKDKVINHHQEVPFRVLEKKYTVGADESDNLIIRGDNLEALKALLPRYEGRVKCVYIDPPYNTGNEGWVYNDNVNDPRIRRWLGAVVGKEGEDLSRHDKWLCMMYPRLRLLHRLLSPDGAIFISIDDAEYSNLKAVCDEIFGPDCFVSNISWQRTYSTRNDSKGIVNEVEHILTYSRRPGWNPNKLPRTEEMDVKYKNPDNDVALWRSDNPFAPGAATHQGMVYAIQHPFTGEMIYPSSGACWRYQQDQMLEIMSGWTAYELRDLHDEEARAIVCGVAAEEVRPGVQAIVLALPLKEAAAAARKVYKRGQWPRFYFTKGGKGGIARKTYLNSVGGRLPTNSVDLRGNGAHRRGEEGDAGHLRRPGRLRYTEAPAAGRVRVEDSGRPRLHHPGLLRRVRHHGPRRAEHEQGRRRAAAFHPRRDDGLRREHHGGARAPGHQRLRQHGRYGWKLHLL